MRILTLLLLASFLSACHYGHRTAEKSPTLVLDSDANLVVLTADGNSFKPTACDTSENPCTAFVEDGKLVDQKSISVSVFQTNNPHCCYTYNFDGDLYEMCWAIPAGTRCPVLK